MSLLRTSAYLSPLLSLVVLAATSSLATAQTTINTIPGNGGLSSGSNVLGQTFTAPTDNVLTSFAVQIDPPDTVTFSVYAYNPASNTTVGNALFTSASPPISTVEGRSGFFFDTGNLTLTRGSTYAALLSGSSNGYTLPFNGRSSDAYTGGTAIAGRDTTGPFTNLSGLFGSPIDLSFRATFVPAAATAVPEPGEWAIMGMLGTSLCGLMIRARRKAKS